MKILVLNGPNINMLGIREPDIYGRETYDDLCRKIKNYAKEKGVEVKLFQSNHEGDLVDEIQAAYNKFDGIVINPAAYTHTSVALLDAVKAVGIKTVADSHRCTPLSMAFPLSRAQQGLGQRQIFRPGDLHVLWRPLHHLYRNACLL